MRIKRIPIEVDEDGRELANRKSKSVSSMSRLIRGITLR